LAAKKGGGQPAGKKKKGIEDEDPPWREEGFFFQATRRKERSRPHEGEKEPGYVFCLKEGKREVSIFSREKVGQKKKNKGIRTTGCCSIRARKKKEPHQFDGEERSTKGLETQKRRGVICVRSTEERREEAKLPAAKKSAEQRVLHRKKGKGDRACVSPVGNKKGGRASLVLPRMGETAIRNKKGEVAADYHPLREEKRRRRYIYVPQRGVHRIIKKERKKPRRFHQPGEGRTYSPA